MPPTAPARRRPRRPRARTTRSACAHELGPVGDEQHRPPAPQPLDGAATSSALAGSRSAVGSSRTTSGAIAQERARQRRSAGARPAESGRPPSPTTVVVAVGQRAGRRRRRRRARPPRAPRASDASGSPSRMLSATLPRRSVGCWGTQATSAPPGVGAAVREVDAADGDAARPSASAKPSSSAATVLLPAPLSPTSATVSPGAQLEVEPVEDAARARRIGEDDALQPHGAPPRGSAASRAPPARAAAGASSSASIRVGDGQAVGARVVLGAQPAQRQVQLGREHEHGQAGLQAERRRRPAARRPSPRRARRRGWRPARAPSPERKLTRSVPIVARR